MKTYNYKKRIKLKSLSVFQATGYLIPSRGEDFQRRTQNLRLAILRELLQPYFHVAVAPSNPT